MAQRNVTMSGASVPTSKRVWDVDALGEEG
jgi:hypothetical protein